MSSDNLLDLRMNHRVGGVSLEVEFALTAPWTVLFGPSGSGKTTILRAIAGFVRPEQGRITRGGVVLLDTATRTFLPPHRRPVRGAAQTALLFPHQTLRENLLYGNGWTSKPADAVEIAEEALSLFRLREFADRRPSGLSGGERQRASVARAVVSAVTFSGPDKALLLLDEPFTGVDAALRDELLLELRDWLKQWSVPVLSVTHTLGEAFQLEAEILKIAEGRIVEQGPANRVLATERERLLQHLRAVPKS